MNLLEKLREREGQEYGNYAASLFATLAGNLDEKEFQGSDVGDFVRFIESIRRHYKAMRISEIVNTVTEETGYEKYMRELGDEEKLSNLVEFKRIANEFEREFGEEISLEEFLGQIALQSGEESGGSKDAVKLMTIHSSKGLEFPVVFVMGFTEGVFPSAKTLGDRKELGLEEERRLCYVAITRAEKYLFLMESEGTAESGARKMLSRFLEDIGEQNYVRIGHISDDLRQASKKYAAKLDWDMQLETAGSRKVGDAVEHHIFGPGVIEAIDEKRGSYSIKFERFELPRDISSRYFTQEHEKLSALREPEAERAPQTVKCGQELVEEIADAEQALESRLDGEELESGIADSGTVDADELPASETAAEEDRIARLNALKASTSNLWKNPLAPHSGWTCAGVEDLGAPVGICQMCGHQIIRYAHLMEHPDYHSLSVGCVCAGRMEGDVAGAKRREKDFKSRQARRDHFCKRQWKISRKGNEYLETGDHIAVLYHDTNGKGGWRYSIDREFGREVYSSREQAVIAVFEALDD